MRSRWRSADTDSRQAGGHAGAARLVAANGTAHATPGPSSTMQSAPPRAWAVIATRGRRKPYRRWPGSVISTVSPITTLSPSGVV